MKLTADSKKLLLDEFEYAIKMMKTGNNADKKLFYFSGLYGALSRIFNIEYDSQLVFMHQILTSAYNNINMRLNALKGGETVVQFPESFFDKLIEIVEELTERIEKNEDTYTTMEKIAILTFITTGNGYYLFEKNIIKI